MYGSQKDIQHNLKCFFVDGITFAPTMSLISITTVIPYFLSELGASTFQVALATSMTLICVFLTQPFFGYIASKAAKMNKTFSRILFIQRTLFLLYILLIPVFTYSDTALIAVFLVSWCIYNLFVGSYVVFYAPLVIRLLPPNRRGAVRGIGAAIGALIGAGLSALIPIILGRIAFPYNYMTIFAIGLFFLLANATVFFLMRQSEDMEPNEPMGMTQYIKKMPETIGESPSFRAMILTCLFLAVANALLPYYTLYAIREFSATETDIAILAILATFAGAITQVVLGHVIDKRGPRITTAISAFLLVAAGVLALTTSSLILFFVVWILANLSNSGFQMSASLLLGEVSPPTKLPLYVGVYFTISTALSAIIVLGLSSTPENVGFVPLFITILTCGLLSLTVNQFILRKRLMKKA